MKRNSNGFTLVELLVVMAVFITVIMIAGSSFNTILMQASKLFRSEESNIEGMVGLEILRHDIQQAGFGLFTDQMAKVYNEAADAPASSYNDATNNVPRPLIAGNDIGAVTNTDDGGLQYNVLADTDYLVIKATSVGKNAASQKWTYLKYKDGPSDVYPNMWPSAAENFANNERVVLLRRKLNSGIPTSSVEPDVNGDFYYAYSNTAFSHLTSAGAANFTVYGVEKNVTTPRMPFNRSDYFVARPQDTTKIPALCASGTGILYKTTINHADGKLNYSPILDCVADMQVVFGWDMNGDGIIDVYSNANGSTVQNEGGATYSPSDVQAAISQANNNSPATIPNIRTSLKMVKIYILAQQGRRDPNFSNTSPIVVGDGNESSLTKSVDVTTGAWSHYRWKVFRIVARPKNLPANQ